MASEDWYQNTTWNDEIEEAFNKKLQRSRSQRAQYLRIQGSLLKDTHPQAGIRLLARCVEAGEDFEIAHALLDTAHAQLVQGDVDAALDTLEAVIEQEKRQPRSRTTAAYDYPFLIAIYCRKERYQSALDLLERHGDGFFESMIFEAETAKALIFEERGEDALAQQASRKALEAASVEVGWLPDHPKVGLVPTLPSQLHGRLQRIARLE